MTDLYSPSEAHIRSYNANVTLLAQQEGSRLSNTVRQDGTVRGNRAHFDALGKGTMQKRTSRHADTYLADTARQRRSAPMVDYERGELVDEEDRLKTLYDPQNPLALVGANAAGVKKDEMIYDALGGSAVEGAGDGAAFSSVALPTAQKIVHGSAGLTFDKIRQAIRLLKNSGSWFMRVNGMNEVYGVLSADTEAQLLDQVEVKSSDHNAAAHQIVQEGSIDGRRFMGVTWIVMPSGVIAQDANSDDLIYIWCKGSVGLGLNRDIQTSFDRRADKSNAMQVLVKINGGATRIDDKGVVEIACDLTTI